jgi:hypothetical protein
MVMLIWSMDPFRFNGTAVGERGDVGSRFVTIHCNKSDQVNAFENTKVTYLPGRLSASGQNKMVVSSPYPHQHS